MPLLGQRPAPKDSALGQPGRKTLLGTQRNGGLGLVLASGSLPAQLMEPGSVGQGHGQTKWVRQRVGQAAAPHTTLVVGGLRAQ